MPIYEYKCKKCGNNFEKLIFGKEKVKCPKCNSNSLKKMIPSSINKGGKSQISNGDNCPMCKY